MGVSLNLVRCLIGRFMINKINMMQQMRRNSKEQSKSRQIDVRNGDVLEQNEEIIENLNKKIDRRLDIGYYCEVPAKRSQRSYQPRKIFIQKNTPQKKSQPIVRRKKKQQKVEYIDCEQNTDQLDLVDEVQNISRVLTEKKEEPDTEDTAMQWSYEVEKVNQESQQGVETVEGSMQYDFVEVQDISIQYEDPQGIPDLVELVERSIQYDLVEQTVEQKKQVVIEDREMQCDVVAKSQKGFQFDEMKPEVMSKKMQIDLPDLKNIQKMEQLKQLLLKAQKQSQRQIKISKGYKSKIEMLKLKQEVTKIQSQIQIAQLNNKKMEEQKEVERQLQTQKVTFLKQRKRDLTSLNRQFENKLSGLIHTLKNRDRLNRNELNINSSTHVPIEKQDANIENSIASTRQQLQKTKNDLKEEMKRRMRYESDQQNEDQNVAAAARNYQLQSSRHLSSSIKMRNLFPNPEKADRLFAGTIIKNISNNKSPQKWNRDNSQYRLANITKAYCERRLQKNGLLNNRDKSLKEDRSILESNLSSAQQIMRLRSSSIGMFRNQNKSINANPNTNKYTKIHQARVLAIEQVTAIESLLKNLFKSEICLKYLYKQQQKMQLGRELFKIFSPQLQIKKQIDILKFSQYLVYTYFYCQITHFIIFYHSFNYVFYGEQPQTITNLVQFFTHPSIYKDCWGIQYSSQIIAYNGEYQRGKKHGLGLSIQGKNIYQGYFQHDVRVGRGSNTFENGDKYEGPFKNNCAHGEGTYYWSNGEKYEGFFQNGKKHGFGRHIYPNGDIFEGFYSNNLKEGRGKYMWNDGKIYEGYYKNDFKCGEGKITYPDNSYFIGIWSDDVCTFVCRKIAAKRSRNLNEANNIRINF